MKGKNSLRKTLFWDVDPKKLNFKKNASFIIGRVLDLGNLKEWKYVQRMYQKKTITNVAKNHVFSDPKSANFWGLILGIPNRKIKCTKNLSPHLPNAFLKSRLEKSSKKVNDSC